MMQPNNFIDILRVSWIEAGRPMKLEGSKQPFRVIFIIIRDMFNKLDGLK